MENTSHTLTHKLFRLHAHNRQAIHTRNGRIDLHTRNCLLSCLQSYFILTLFASSCRSKLQNKHMHVSTSHIAELNRNSRACILIGRLSAFVYLIDAESGRVAKKLALVGKSITFDTGESTISLANT